MKLNDIPLDDPDALALLGRGETSGIFQVESPGMVGLLRSVRPSSLEDISAVLALYRPGPLDNGSHTEYARRKRDGVHSPDIHRDLDSVLLPILSETYGLIVYQEQVMRIIAEITGWSYAEAEDIFTAMRKKKLEKMESSKPAFFQAAADRGYSTDSVQALWAILIPFSDYSFNKSHSVGYAHITYYGAYLKANHPKQFMAALLSRAGTAEKKKGWKSEPSDRDKYLTEATRMGLAILPPDVNTSGADFTPVSEGIRYGISSIKGIGIPTTEALLSRRPYRSIDDFFWRAPAKVLNLRVLEALTKSGVLDSLWGSRSQLVLEAPNIVPVVLEARRAAREGQHGLIRRSYRPQASPTQEGEDHRAEWERQYLGVQLSYPAVSLALQRPLSPQEWAWLKERLDTRGGDVYATLRNTRFKLPHKSIISDTLVSVCRLLDIEVS